MEQKLADNSAELMVGEMDDKVVAELVGLMAVDLVVQSVEQWVDLLVVSKVEC